MADNMPNETKELSLELLKQGNAAFIAGDYRESLAHLLEAFMLNNSDPDIQASFINILSHTSGFKLPKPVTDILADAVIENGHNAQDLAPVLASHFEDEPSIDALISFLENVEPGQITEIPEGMDTAAILNDQLFLLVCTKATIISPTIERLLCVLRQHYLGEWLADTSSQSYFLDNHPATLAAIACQSFNSEYIYAVTDEENDKIDGLATTIQEDIRGAHPFELAILGAYRSLWDALKDGNPDDLQYLVDQSPRWQGWVKLVWKVQFLSPFRETLIKQQLAQLTPIEESLSQTVARQYEAYPYPRWQSTKVATKQLSLASRIGTRFPHINTANIPEEPVDILFAGCGTGEQVVQMSTGLQYKNILAVDLSQNSLAYAKRKIEERGQKNMHFGQADILAVKNWDASFDLIVCTGVLHHMGNPSAGLAALLAVSKPHTLFSLALYSERGRAHVVAARELIAEHNIPDTLDGMRQFRALVRQLPVDHPVKPVADSREFYSASGLHDYVFNTHELRYTPLQLKALLDDHGLIFIGFDIGRGDYIAAYKVRFPDDPTLSDLENWDQFEQDVPDVFEDMLQFWCIKKPTENKA